MVLGDLVVDHRDDVGADGRLVHRREGARGAAGLLHRILRVHGNNRTGRGQRHDVAKSVKARGKLVIPQETNRKRMKGAQELSSVT